jgi:hypothetical protein
MFQITVTTTVQSYELSLGKRSYRSHKKPYIIFVKRDSISQWMVKVRIITTRIRRLDAVQLSIIPSFTFIAIVTEGPPIEAIIFTYTDQDITDPIKYCVSGRWSIFNLGERDRNKEDPCQEMKVAVAVDIYHERYRNLRPPNCFLFLSAKRG